MWEESQNVYLLPTEFDHAEVTVYSWQDVKIQLLTNYISTFKLSKSFTIMNQW